ncbi:MAG: prolipoprotein diacylglyceryl transferase [Alphaproteobacteria bacterium]
MFFFPFPAINPIFVQLGPLAVYWYGIIYALSIFLCWKYTFYLAKRFPSSISHDLLNKILIPFVWAIVIGSRLGHVLFYDFNYYMQNPVEIVKTWHGGMSFHGGVIGAALVILFYSFKRKIQPLLLSDLIAIVLPVGLFLGRIANFINQELYGRVTDAPWAVIFPRGGFLPRHPTQLYESFFEGLILGGILYGFWRKNAQIKKPGVITGVFFAFYSLFRFLIEFLKDPEYGYIHVFSILFTTGQILCIPMFFVGILLIWLYKFTYKQN